MDISPECLRKNLKAHLQEIEILQSIFCGEGELVFYNPSLLSDLESALEGADDLLYNFLSCFEINVAATSLPCSSGNSLEAVIKIRVEMTVRYPSIELPRFYVYADILSRKSSTLLNKEIEEFIDTLEKGECVVLNVVNFIKEEASRHVSEYFSSGVHACNDSKSCNASPEEVGVLRAIVLKMHHIYSIEKRKQIVSWAHENMLTGFSLPGKPGVVYVEGLKTDVDDFFKRLRALSWQKMTLELEEQLNDSNPRRFSSFKEMAFDVRGKRGYHMDMGQFREFLSENNLPHIFSLLFDLK